LITRYHFKYILSSFGTSLISSILFYKLVHDWCNVGDAVLPKFCCYSPQKTYPFLNQRLLVYYQCITPPVISTRHCKGLVVR
ncbi:hypothetical protein T12_7088, partial [Trichinella patagoniensis]